MIDGDITVCHQHVCHSFINTSRTLWSEPRLSEENQDSVTSEDSGAFVFVRMTPDRVSPLSLFVLVSVCVALSTPSSPPQTDGFLGPIECLERNLTRDSCELVFCRPWEYCVHGQCSCKPAYLCPAEGVAPVCGRGNKQLRSYCQAMAVSCLTDRPLMSHFGETCTADQPNFRDSIEPGTGVVRLFVPDTGSTGSTGGGGQELLVCQELWDMAAANVVCRENGYPLGSESSGTVSSASLMSDLNNQKLPGKCVSVRCQGYENSLAECVIYDKTDIHGKDVATATCVQTQGDECEFRCVNRKCVSLSQTCDGVDDCGDRSDEMCCTKCRSGAFRCRTGVCLHEEAVGDGKRDCLDGEDESKRHTKKPLPLPTNTEYISPKSETRASRLHLESRLNCGVPKPSGGSDEEEEGGRGRFRRVVGGQPTRPTQIQWQVALDRKGVFLCGGAFIGGCWVVTAAHCLGTPPSPSSWTPPSLSIAEHGVPGRDRHVNQKLDPASLKVKFSVWRRLRAQSTTDIVPVQDVHIHPKYNPDTRENDIALVQLEKLQFQDECLPDNPAVSPVCVPWTTRLFQPNHTCTVSGWGQDAGGRLSQVLQWASVSLIEDCQRFHNDSIKPGMICAGDQEGRVSPSRGDNGGPLVCEDELGVSYLWGIVSWGKGSPGVYTQVAHYFEWIRYRTGWTAVTKFNSQ